MNTDHHEFHLEQYICQKLVAQGWLEGQSRQYDQQFALYPEDVVAWLQATQKDKWDKLVQIFGEQAQSKLLEKIAKRLAVVTGGTIAALRDGLQIAGVGQIDLTHI